MFADLKFVQLTSDNSSPQPTHTHDLTPVTPIDPHCSPAFFTTPVRRAQLLHTRAWVFSYAILSTSDVARVEFWIAKIGPDGGYVHGVGSDPHPEAAVHVGGNL